VSGDSSWDDLGRRYNPLHRFSAFGDYFSLVVSRKDVKGLLAVTELPLWNVWLDT